MKARMTLIALALAGAVATTGALAHGGHGYGPGARGDMRGPPSAEQVTQRLGTLKSELKLQPGQAAAWNAFEAKIVANAQARAKMHESRPARGDRDAMADFRVSMMKFNAQAADETNQARKALVATLSPEQKATFDAFRPGPGPMAGGRGDGSGPGHRHGDGPRGGCMGMPGKA